MRITYAFVSLYSRAELKRHFKSLQNKSLKAELFPFEFVFIAPVTSDFMINFTTEKYQQNKSERRDAKQKLFSSTQSWLDTNKFKSHYDSWQQAR